jgi:predicted kinase
MVIEMNKRAQYNKRQSRQDLRKELAEKNACFVLITCGEPTEDGKMQVEMTYEGDASLAAFLIESAQGFIE